MVSSTCAATERGFLNARGLVGRVRFRWIAVWVAVVEAKRHHRRACDTSEARDPGASCPSHLSPNDCCVIEGSPHPSQLAGPVAAEYIDIYVPVQVDRVESAKDCRPRPLRRGGRGRLRARLPARRASRWLLPDVRRGAIWPSDLGDLVIRPRGRAGSGRVRRGGRVADLRDHRLLTEMLPPCRPPSPI